MPTRQQDDFDIYKKIKLVENFDDIQSERAIIKD